MQQVPFIPLNTNGIISIALSDTPGFVEASDANGHVTLIALNNSGLEALYHTGQLTAFDAIRASHAFGIEPAGPLLEGALSSPAKVTPPIGGPISQIRVVMKKDPNNPIGLSPEGTVFLTLTSNDAPPSIERALRIINSAFPNSAFATTGSAIIFWVPLENTLAALSQAGAIPADNARQLCEVFGLDFPSLPVARAVD